MTMRAMLPTKAVGERLRRLRQERRITQTDLARQIGIQQSDLSRMENGEYRVSLDTLFRLLQIFQLPLAEFFGDLSESSLTSPEANLLQSFRALSRESQREVLDFVAFKRDRSGVDGG